MTTNVNAWTEFCLIGVIPNDGAAEVQLAGCTEDITGIDFGDKDIEGMPLVNGGRVVKKKPQEDESITFKGYPIGVANDGTGYGQFFSGTVLPTADPFIIFNDARRRTNRVTLTWREDLPAAFGTLAAGSAVPAGTGAYRITAINAYCTHYKPSFDDKILSAEVTFKWAPFNKTGTPNRREESVGTGGLGSGGTSTVAF